MTRTAVLTYPDAFYNLKLGFDQLADLLALTLGPVGGVVLSTTAHKDAPEPLNDAAVIARRILALPDRSQDIGAMLIRNLVWRVHQRVGDGSALAAVLSQAILGEAARYVAAAANPMSVQDGIRRGVKAASGALTAMSQPVETEADLVAIAQAVTHQPDLSLVLGELYHLLGPHAYIHVENYLAPYLERVYLNGGQWKAKLVSPYLMTAPARREAILNDPWVVVYDGDLSDAGELGPLFRLAQSKVQAAKKPFHLLLFSRAINGDALNTLVSAHVSGLQQKDGGLRVIAVNAQRPGEKLRADLADLAALTGASVISAEWGRSLLSLQESDLGRARRAEATPDALMLIDGKGAPMLIREQIQSLQKRLLDLRDEVKPTLDPDQGALDEIAMRLARLSGSTAVLKIGANAKSERDVLRQKAEQGIKALKAALAEGYLPGGGVAYCHCVAAVEALQGSNPDESMGIQAVARALEAPFNRILKNARIDAPGVILGDIRQWGDDLIFDVLDKEIVSARQAGLLDSTKVLRVALETAASGAMLAVSTGAVILKRKPKISYEP